METADLVAQLRRVGTDFSDVEVKSAAGRLPKSVVDTLSAFANGSGGTLLLGLDESTGFQPAPGFDAGRIRDALAGACADKMEPALRAAIEMQEFEDALIVRLDVTELDPIERPSFVKARGAYQGSFIRGGDGDRLLTHYEVSQLLSNRTQPTYDRETVEQSSVSDLDETLIGPLLARARQRAPRAFANVDDTTALIRLGVLGSDGERPTLAGLLCLGVYPQQFFPQLFISFVAVPGTELGQTTVDGVRFLDNQTIDGPIPVMLTEAATALRRNMNKAAIVRGLGREDRYDYPLDAIRELLVNALMHRDYSPGARGAQIQVELYADRLVVKSPGGLYGAVGVDSLGTAEQMSSSRNSTLAKLLSDLPLSETRDQAICENRGSGLPGVMNALRRVGMSPPEFKAVPGQLTVRVPQQALLSVETIEWIGTLHQEGLTDQQHLALAMMRGTGRVTNGMLQAWGVDQTTAGLALRDLVKRGLAILQGGKRYARYVLAVSGDPPLATREPATGDLATGQVSVAPPGNQAGDQQTATAHQRGVEAELDSIVQAIQAGFTTSRTLSEKLSIKYHTMLRRIDALVERGLIEATQPRNSPKQSYRIVNPKEQE